MRLNQSLRRPAVSRIAGRACYWSWLRVVLVAVVQGGSAELLGDDLDGRPGAAILGRPAPLLEATTRRPSTAIPCPSSSR